VSSSGIIYTHVRPFGSQILKARYLTQQTSSHAAQRASQILLQEEQQQQHECNNNNNNNNNNTTTDAAAAKRSNVMNQVYGIYDEEFNLTTDPYASKRVLELTLSLPDDFSLSYEPGDSLGLLVPNPPSVVHDFLELFSLTEEDDDAENNMLIRLVEDEGTKKNVVSLHYLLTHVLDLSSPLTNKQILKRMLQQLLLLLLLPNDSYSSSSSEDDNNNDDVLALYTMMNDFTNEDWEEFYQEKYTVVEWMQQFPILYQQISWQDWVSVVLPTQTPRYYSVSSSPLVHTEEEEEEEAPQVTIAFSVVDYLTPSGRRKGGVATRYLEAMASSVLVGGGSSSSSSSSTIKLPIFPKPTTEFRLPPSLMTPLVLIGPGTGIAPFIGFLQHRRKQFQLKSKSLTNMLEGTWRGSFEMEEKDAKQQQQQEAASITPPIHVYFGCRHEDHDYLYREELQEFVDTGLISQLQVAFSRSISSNSNSGETPNNNKQCCYVQDLINEQTIQLITDEQHKDATVYICGDGNRMAKDVQTKLQELLLSHTTTTTTLEELKQSQRLVLDIWS